ncbi:MAG: hypothetical protein ACI4V1_08980 [Eubacteriales bacterium]
MKKFLSLALALLMMVPLAVSASAGVVYKNDNPKSSDIVTVEEFQNLLNYWQWTNSDKYDYQDLLDYLYGQENVKSWADYCDKCHAKAKYFVTGGDVYCNCPTCGVYEVEVDLNLCSCCSRCTGNSKCTCGCWDCLYDRTCPQIPVSHKYSSCELNDVSFYWYGNIIYWYCDNCRQYGFIDADDWDSDWNDYFWDYNIRVLCSRGGTYYIDGSSSADYGDTRTITFEADYGYVLTDVVVNGISYGYCPILPLTVTSDVTIRATFVKASTLKTCTFTASVTGNGSVKAIKNNQTVSSSAKFTAKYGDSVTYKFVPASGNYYVKNVVVDGKSMGAITSYSFNTGITADHSIKVTFEWRSPYNDVSDKYLDAVEYVTEAGIMGYYNKYVYKNAFCGTKEISVKNLAAALAEMADVNDKLDTVAERIEWAEKNGIIDGDADLTVTCDVQSACGIVHDYLTLLEKQGKIDFTDFDKNDSAKENAISIGLVSSTTYKNNRSLNRYDLASICRLLANLEY